MTIHTFGDSHCSNGWSHVDCHHLGPKLCYSFGTKKLEICDIRAFDNIKDGDILVFCFGEIDCRCHIHKYINDNKTYQEIIDDIIENYFEAIKLNINLSGLYFKYICVYNIVPPVQRDNTPENPEYPFLGTDEERKMYTLYFNEQLQKKCFENNYIFFDIYDKYTDENGFLRKDLSDGKVHIRDGIYIMEFINDYF